MSKPTLEFTRGARLPELLKQRIVIIDGAMGTMIQRYKLQEARSEEHTSELQSLV